MTLVGLLLALLSGSKLHGVFGPEKVLFFKNWNPTFGFIMRGFRGITFGAVVLSKDEQAVSRITYIRHERCHVRQYFTYGIFFLPVYLILCAWAGITTGKAYWNCILEIEARAAEQIDA